MPIKKIVLSIVVTLLFVTAAILFQRQFADDIRMFINPITPVTFEAKSIPWTRLSFGDHNNDGYIETIGTTNNGSGELIPTTIDGIPAALINSVNRWEGIRALQVDLNQDNREDIIFSPYEDCTGDCLYPARLFLQQGNGKYVENLDFLKQNIYGNTETLIVADLDNDGDLDIFVPAYDRFYLLRNDGDARFTELSDQAGVTRGGENIPNPEGGQALDINMDGCIDLYMGSQLFINDCNWHFTDVRESMGLPVFFDEGFKFLDFNNDGLLDIAANCISSKSEQCPAYQLWLFDAGKGRYELIPDAFGKHGRTYWGMNIWDMNNDGWEDVIFHNLIPGQNRVFLNDRGSGFVRSYTTPFSEFLTQSNWGAAFGDVDKDGLIDILVQGETGLLPGTGKTIVLYNTTKTSNIHFSINVLGKDGQRNQQGRPVHIFPKSDPGFLMTRIVEGGSGYVTQNQYVLLVGSPFNEPHHATVHFPEGVVEFDIQPGECMQVRRQGGIRKCD